MQMASFAAVARGRYMLGSAFFCASLNHKQMSLYLAPAMFAHLLGRCLQRPTALKKLGLLAALGLAVVASFIAAWWPFLASAEDALAVLRRVFPTQRGLFEDYVANFW